jgi:hypothetical protein
MIRRARLKFERDYVQIPNRWMRDGRLSHRARGLLGEIMTHSPDWVITLEALIENGTEGRDAVKVGLHELVDHGYLALERERVNGKLRGSHYVLTDPDDPGEDASEERIFSRPENRPTENPPSKKTSSLEDKKDSLVPPSGPDAEIELRPDVEAVCAHLADRVAANGSKRPTITAEWRKQARLLIDRDGRTPEQIHRCIDWCQNDPFWSTNILAMPKLRKQYDQLRLKAIAEQEKVKQLRPKQAVPAYDVQRKAPEREALPW